MGSVTKRLLLTGLLVSVAVLMVSPRVRSTDLPPKVVKIRQVATSAKVVALTFDDGPDPRFTPALLDTLDRYGIKATFFVIGEAVENYPDIARDIVRRGHTIANHTHTHPPNNWVHSPQQVRGELDACNLAIVKHVGLSPMYFRPPRGKLSGTVEIEAAKRGYQTILWSVSANNRRATNPQLMAERVVRGVRPGGIILAHDGGFEHRWMDVEATPLIIEALHKQGYRFVTIPELISPKLAKARVPFSHNPFRKR